MTVKFCPKCDSVLIPEKSKEGKIETICHHCGYIGKFNSKALVEKEKITGKGKTGGKIAKEENTFATYKHKCQKCGFGKAEVIDIGPFYSDEDNVILLKCGKCGWSERTTKKSG